MTNYYVTVKNKEYCYEGKCHMLYKAQGRYDLGDLVSSLAKTLVTEEPLLLEIRAEDPECTA